MAWFLLKEQGMEMPKPRDALFLGLMLMSLLPLSGCKPRAARGTVGTYEFTAIARGTLEKTVSSSGSLKPVAIVEVLPRMSGKVERVYGDYNDIIRKGQVLAELNTDMLKLQREQQLASVIKARANYELQLLTYQNQQQMAEKNLIAAYELRTGKTTLDIHAAELAAAEASLRVIETEINQYAFITSPIDGIVLERNINEGETVADSSSSNAASIFTLAENLEEMRIETGVGELEIASIHPGQEVRFTLEALPGRTFSGTVASKRLMPTVTDNVVAYTVIITVDNRDGALLPGMTCAVEFIEERRDTILRVPNAALRYQPSGLSAEAIADRIFNAGLQGMHEAERNTASAARAASQQAAQNPGAAGPRNSGGLPGLMMQSGPGRGRDPARQAGPGSGVSGPPMRTGRSDSTAPRTLWFINDQGKLDLILVRTGISDGSFTEVHAAQGLTDEELEGMRIILRERVG
ncbi:MAG: efflux RND transporter periplasmic adaptor subunit [Treponema sp.]|jgi:HlyD family secretion protein|nr:efflux RND transporter periplasmic adaptor subunit [Treponema sp.]